MNVINMKVYHGKFGEGVVTEQSGSIMTVEFSEGCGEKKFHYPAAFESFLTCKSPEMACKMAAEVQEMHRLLEAQKRQRLEEAKARQEAKRQALMEQKRTASKRRSPAKKTPPPPPGQGNGTDPAIKEGGK